MTKRVCRNENDLRDWSRYLYEMAGDGDAKFPITCSWVKGDDRTNAQNALSHKWFAEVAMFFGDRQAHDVKAHCKLYHGIKLLHAENEQFREQWNRLIRGRYTEEELLDLMLPPHDYPVSRIMKVKQMNRYMDAIYNEFSAQGVPLTVPDIGE